MSSNNDENASNWNRLRYWYRAFLILLFGGLVPAFLLSFPGFSRQEDIFIPCWMFAVFFTAWKFKSFRCPRCNKPFFRPSFWAYNDFAKTCPHCGLRKWG